MTISMKVAGLTIDPLTQMPILILKDMAENSSVPIWIGPNEAQAIANELEQLEIVRPLTHDFIRNLFERLGGKLQKIRITDLIDHTYLAQVVIVQGDHTFELAARPSDALALAVRTGCPIEVEDKVVHKAGEMDLRPDMPLFPKMGSKSDEESLRELLARIPDDEFGKWKM